MDFEILKNIFGSDFAIFIYGLFLGFVLGFRYFKYSLKKDLKPSYSYFECLYTKGVNFCVFQKAFKSQFHCENLQKEKGIFKNTYHCKLLDKKCPYFS